MTNKILQTGTSAKPLPNPSSLHQTGRNSHRLESHLHQRMAAANSSRDKVPSPLVSNCQITNTQGIRDYQVTIYNTIQSRPMFRQISGSPSDILSCSPHKLSVVAFHWPWPSLFASMNPACANASTWGIQQKATRLEGKMSTTEAHWSCLFDFIWMCYLLKIEGTLKPISFHPTYMMKLLVSWF